MPGHSLFYQTKKQEEWYEMQKMRFTYGLIVCPGPKFLHEKVSTQIREYVNSGKIVSMAIASSYKVENVPD
jgi:hypothetical protein